MKKLAFPKIRGCIDGLEFYERAEMNKCIYKGCRKRKNLKKVFMAGVMCKLCPEHFENDRQLKEYLLRNSTWNEFVDCCIKQALGKGE